jgi:hypothetical protein
MPTQEQIAWLRNVLQIELPATAAAEGGVSAGGSATPSSRAARPGPNHAARTNQDPDYVSMRLDDSPPSGKPVQMEPLKMGVDVDDDASAAGAINAKEQLSKDVLTKAQMAVTLSRVNCDRLGLQTLYAAQKFKKYADPLLEDLEKQETPVGLIGPLLTITVGVIGGRLGEKLGEEIGKLGGQIVDKVVDAVKEKFVKGVEGKLDNDTSLKALKAGVDALIEAAQASATQVSTAAGEGIEAMLKAIIKQTSSKQPLSPDQGKVMVRFLDSSDLDATLETFGVPSGATAKAIQGDILAGWVKALHVKLLEHQNERNSDKDYMEPLSSKEINRLAEQHAKEARKSADEEVDNAGASAPH